MIQRIVDKFMAAKEQIAEEFREHFPDGYEEIVKVVVDALQDDELDPKRIHTIDDGEYQGILLFIIGEKGYQPSDYHYVKIDYGSCSGCDTLQAIDSERIWKNGGRVTRQEQIDDLLKLSLHIVQGL